MNKVNLLLIVLLPLLFISCKKDKEEVLDPTEYKELINVEYGNHARQQFDLYLPANRNENTKVLILIHGGAWRSGSKNDMNELKNFVQDNFPNLAIANMNYRLANNSTRPFPMQTDDITLLVNHLTNNQSNYTVSNDLGMLGVSAGAHLSMLWSYAHDNDSKVKMVCSWVGPTNLADTAYLNSTNPDIQNIYAQFGAGTLIPYLEENSPVFQVTANAPPTLLLYGGQDPLVPTSQGMDMRDKLVDLSVTHEFKFYPNAGHGFVGTDLFDAAVSLEAFMETHFQ